MMRASTAAPESAVLHVGGLYYASENAVVERVLARRPGVISVEANPVPQTATVVYDPDATSVHALHRLVEECGYHCAGQSAPGQICDPLGGRLQLARDPDRRGRVRTPRVHPAPRGRCDLDVRLQRDRRRERDRAQAPPASRPAVTRPPTSSNDRPSLARARREAQTRRRGTGHLGVSMRRTSGDDLLAMPDQAGCPAYLRQRFRRERSLVTAFTVKPLPLDIAAGARSTR
jgi:copper chaperone CopZ